MAKREILSSGSPGKLIQIAVGLFFIALGIVELTSYNSGASEFMRGVSKAFGGKSDIMTLIIALLELVSGILMFASMFISLSRGLVKTATLCVGVFWLIRIVIYYILNNFLEPGFFPWLYGLSVELLVLASVWMVYREN